VRAWVKKLCNYIAVERLCGCAPAGFEYTDLSTGDAGIIANRRERQPAEFLEVALNMMRTCFYRIAPIGTPDLQTELAPNVGNPISKEANDRRPPYPLWLRGMLLQFARQMAEKRKRPLR
jgi:hypothetical protein